ncbi:MAG: class I SAM-dependent methyltransferase [Actinomycetota bacterium]|nr:class I SAM-dependent methyltransferase [Actinomycetota bacterium]
MLEIGGGTGMMLSTLKQVCRPEQLVCSDIDRRDATDLVCDAVALPVPDAAFDVVVAFEVLEHVADTDRLLCEVRRAVKPGGYVVISVPFLLGIHDFRDFYRFTDQGLVEVLGRHGLEVVRLRKVGGISASVVGLLTEFLRSVGLAQRQGWRHRSRRECVNYAVSSIVTLPLMAASWPAFALDSIIDADSENPAGFLVIARRHNLR